MKLKKKVKEFFLDMFKTNILFILLTTTIYCCAQQPRSPVKSFKLNCCAREPEVVFNNPFHNLRSLIFNDSNNIIQTRNERIFRFNLNTKINSEIHLNYDSIIKICYKTIFRDDFDSAWNLRMKRGEKIEKETNIVNFKSMKNANYIFCRLYSIGLDTLDDSRKCPFIYILKTDNKFKLLEIFCVPSKFVRYPYAVNGVPNGEVTFENDSTLSMTLCRWMAVGTSVDSKDKKIYKEQLDLCWGTFYLHHGKLSMISLNGINNVYKIFQSRNMFMTIDNITGKKPGLFAYHTSIPIIYDIANNENINLFDAHQTDTATLIKLIENDTYEIKYCATNETQLTIFYTVKDSTYIGKYNLKNKTLSQNIIDVPINHKPLHYFHNVYTYAIITKDEIKIYSTKIN